MLKRWQHGKTPQNAKAALRRPLMHVYVLMSVSQNSFLSGLVDDEKLLLSCSISFVLEALC